MRRRRRWRSTRAAAWARKRSASATTSRRSRPTTRTSPAAPSASASWRAPRPTRRSPRSIPNDDEAQIFYALYLAGTQLQCDQTYGRYLKAAAILEKQFTKHPDHPGVAHYLIHSYDAPPIAQQGMAAARRYAADRARRRRTRCICPRTSSRASGRGRSRSATNRRSARVGAEGQGARRGAHALDYVAYAYLQLGARQRCAQGDRRGARLQGIQHQYLHRLVRGRGDARALRARARRTGAQRRSCEPRARTSFLSPWR